MIVGGTVRVPGDKSITHRALLLRRAGAGNEPRRRRAHLARRAEHAPACCGSSAPRSRRSGPASVGPVAGRGRLRRPEATLDCGNSGTTTRLLLGLLAGAPVRGHADRRCVAPPPSDAAGHGAARADGRAVRRAGAATGFRSRCAAARWCRCATRCRSRARRSRARSCWPASRARSRSSSGSRTAARAITRERLLRAFGYRGGGDRRLDPASPRAAGSSRSSSRCRAIRPRPRSSSGAAMLAEGGELRIAARGRESDADRVPRGARADGRAGRRSRTRPSTSASRWAIWSCARPQLRATEVAAGEIPGLIDEIPLLAVLASRARGHDHLPRGRRASGQGERPARPHRREPSVGGMSRRGLGRRSARGRRRRAAARAGARAPATTAWRWRSPCSAPCRARGSGWTTWRARRSAFRGSPRRCAASRGRLGREGRRHRHRRAVGLGEIQHGPGRGGSARLCAPGLGLTLSRGDAGRAPRGGPPGPRARGSARRARSRDAAPGGGGPRAHASARRRRVRRISGRGAGRH